MACQTTEGRRSLLFVIRNATSIGSIICRRSFPHVEDANTLLHVLPQVVAAKAKDLSRGRRPPSPSTGTWCVPRTSIQENDTLVASCPADNSSETAAATLRIACQKCPGFPSSMLACLQGHEASLEQASSSSDEGDEGDDEFDGDLDEDDRVAAAAAAAAHTRSGVAVGPPAAGPGS